MFDDINGMNAGDSFGAPVDPLMLSWGLFEGSGNPGFYMLYRDLFDLTDEDDDRRFE